MVSRRNFFPFLLTLLAFAASAEPPSVRSGDSPYLTSLISRASALKLDEEDYWKVILHYRPRWLGGLKSEIQGASFFNSPQGRTNPRAELESTLRAFFGDERGSKSAQCRFVDRYRWLRDRLAFDPRQLPEQNCDEFALWRKALDPEGVTLVFSSYYMGNPSSTFGHTLLRLNHRGRSKGEELLDYGVNYSASPTTTNALAYGVLGMTGGFDGQFSNVPYFLKVAEYNDLESRELWEYDLNLRGPELDRMMAHLWTVGHILTPYYFFDQNCSYMLLTILDAARPELKLAEGFSSWVIPADTVRAVVDRKDLVKSVEVRPSLAFRIRRQRADLTAPEDELFFRLIGDSPEADLTAIKQLEPSRARRIWDLTLDYLRYLKPKSKGTLPPRLARLQSEVLLARSEIAEPSPEITFTPEEFAHARPDLGHRTAQATLGTGYQLANRGFVDFGIRPAFHDLNASNQGYPEGMEIDLLDFEGRYSPAPSIFRVERASLINLIALAPWDPIFHKISWSARIGADATRDFACRDCLEYKANVGGGLSTRVASAVLLYGLLKAEVGFGAAYTPGYRLGPAGEAGMVATFSDNWSFAGSASYHHPFLGYRPAYAQASTEIRLTTSRNSDIRLGYDFFETTSQSRLLYHVYF